MDDPARTRHDPERSGFQPSARQIGGGLIALVLIVFVVSNRAETTVEFLGFDVTLRLWLILAITAVLGALVGALLGARRQKRRARA